MRRKWQIVEVTSDGSRNPTGQLFTLKRSADRMCAGMNWRGEIKYEVERFSAQADQAA